ncbi:MAG: ribosome biogenesis GTP-binding protein YihA/YsxC [Clostridia bacterium]|jgi:GTP-binding protein|nr:ribosome biogenesis GTP-binding protein YihA/YsxC [Clostridia bacterium]
MRVNNVELECVTGMKSQFPETGLPEIAFAGKSNVGKSSLINSMMYRKSLARTSSDPGKTRTINFYNIENDLYFVDLPGYGYAKVSKKEREKWGKFIEDYLKERETLRTVLLLIDIRHEPGANDIQMYDWLAYYDFNVVVIATKKDKIKRSQLQKHLSGIRKGLNMRKDDIIIPFSSETKEGRDELWDLIENLI